MKKLVLLLLAGALVGFGLVGCQGGSSSNSKSASADTSKTVTQSDGSELTFENAPQKVAVLSSSTLEIIDALGIDIVATSSLTTKPELAEKFKGITNVGTASKPDMEVLASVAPDVIIAGSSMSLKEQFDAQNYKVWFTNNANYDDTLKLIEAIGHLFNKSDAAASLIADFETRKNAVLDKNKAAEKKTVMIIFGAGQQMYLGTDRCYSGSLAKLLGHKNVADNMDLTGETSGYIPFTMESAVSTKPDVILRIAHGNPEETKKMFAETLDVNPAYTAMQAVKDGKVYDLSYELFFSNPGLKCIDALETLNDLIGK